VAKPAATYQKLRGGYYTPEPIGKFLANWAIQSSNASILEPSCGDGGLLACAFDRLVDCGTPPKEALNLIHGVELDEDEAQEAALRFKNVGAATIHVGDFFSYCEEHLANKRLFDVVIGNPPFIRYQNFPEQHREIAFRLMNKAGLHPNRLTNAWVPFLVAATLLLNPHGRLAMIIPAELLQVNYAAELRQFLSQFYRRITLITFQKLVFEGIQQEVVLLLGERDGIQESGIRTIEIARSADLENYSDNWASTILKEMDHSTEKWTMYFLDRDELSLLRELKAHPGIIKADQFIDVDVGIVTGLNDYFVLTRKQVRNYKLANFTRPLVGRSNNLGGLVFNDQDWQRTVHNEAGAYLLDIPKMNLDALPEAVKEYIAYGELKGAHTGFKCRNRTPWYVVPSMWNPAAFMLRQVHSYPKIVLNAADATCTDTIHRVRFRNNASPMLVATGFLNSLTFAFSEIIGRSYGGGVLELEPNEAEQLPLPMINEQTIDPAELDSLLRNNDIHAVLQITDEVLLKKGLGLSGIDVVRLRGIWEKLRDRRINRKHERKSKVPIQLF
jgi:adenine-specific DNA-methyltransferase